MKVNRDVKVRDRKVSLKTVVVTAFLVGLLVFAGTYYSLSARAYIKPLWLDLEIQPQNMKLGVNQSGTFWVLIHNGTKPYTIEWVSDGKVIGSEASVTFMPFLQPSNMTTLTVHVTDAQGNSGFASTTIYDPATINVYLDDLPSQATYTIKSDGTNYWAVRYDGYKASESTIFDTVMSYCITQCNHKGVIALKANTNYQLTVGAISIVGLGTDWNVPTTQLSIIGEGISTVITQTVASANGIELSNAAHVNLRNFKLVMPNTNSGHGIYGLDTGANSKESITSHSYIGEIIIFGVDSTHVGMWLKNPFFCDFGYLQFQTNNCPNGFIFDATDAAYHVGNCHFRHIVANYLAAGGYALTLQASAISAVINLCTFDHIDIATPFGGGIQLKVSANSTQVTFNEFNGCDLEAAQKQIYLNFSAPNPNTTNALIECNTFNGMIISNNGVTAIDASGNNSNSMGNGGNVFDFTFYFSGDGSTAVLVNDGNKGYAPRNEYKFRQSQQNVDFIASNFVLTSNNNGYPPKFSWTNSRGQQNPWWGNTTSVTNGTWVTHHVGLTPTFTLVTGTIIGEMVSIIAKNSTHFQVAIIQDDGTAGTSQTIYWYAGWNSV